jgi:hypothetical protein
MCKLAHCKNLLRFVVLIVFIFITGCGQQKPMTVARVIQDAKSLDGQTIQVRGLANLRVDPSRAEMWMFGGCAPGSPEGHVVGWLTLYDPLSQGQDNPDNAISIKIAESSFHCEGNYCKITCSPFQATSYEMYEFVGTLRVNGDSDFTLENIDLEQSSWFVNGEWKPISAGNFDVMFP